MTTKSAIQLSKGDVIVAPDGSKHTVTEIQHHGLAGVLLTIVTDTGLSIDKTEFDAKADVYEIEEV